MLAPLPLLLTTILLALSQTRAEEDAIVIYDDFLCQGKVVASGDISGPGGEDWIDTPADVLTRSFQVSGQYGPPKCLFMTKDFHGCEYKKLDIGEEGGCGVLPLGDWKSLWVKQVECPKSITFECTQY